MNINNSLNKLKYDADNFRQVLKDQFELNDNLEQVDTFDNNTNQSFYLEIEDSILLP